MQKIFKVVPEKVIFKCYSKDSRLNRSTTIIDGYSHLFPELCHIIKDKTYYFLWNNPHNNGLTGENFQTLEQAREFVKNNCYLVRHGDNSHGYKIIHPKLYDKYSHHENIDGVWDCEYISTKNVKLTLKKL